MSVIIVIVIIGFVIGFIQNNREKLEVLNIPNKKNVVLITTDGLETAFMSVYGYEKDTTPFLRTLAPKALIARNHFSNSGNTGGSITSILTGKHPTTNRVLYRPDILRGEKTAIKVFLQF